MAEQLQAWAFADVLQHAHDVLSKVALQEGLDAAKLRDTYLQHLGAVEVRRMDHLDDSTRCQGVNRSGPLKGRTCGRSSKQGDGWCSTHRPRVAAAPPPPPARYAMGELEDVVRSAAVAEAERLAGEELEGALLAAMQELSESD